jgi:hypothetical protein
MLQQLESAFARQSNWQAEVWWGTNEDKESEAAVKEDSEGEFLRRTQRSKVFTQIAQGPLGY